MEENKWFILSRSLWATLVPMALLILNQMGVTGADQMGELANTAFNGVSMVVAGVLQFLAMRNPQPTNIAKWHRPSSPGGPLRRSFW